MALYSLMVLMCC